MLLATMKQIGRDDLVEVISRERETQCPSPSVFLTYQWDIQDEVKELRNFLELVGFTCWMDMGQIGGGELLYEKIDHGIRNAKVETSIPSDLPFTLCSLGGHLLYDTDVHDIDDMSTWISLSWHVEETDCAGDVWVDTVATHWSSESDPLAISLRGFER